MSGPCSLVYASDSDAERLRRLLPRPLVIVRDARELADETRSGGTIAFVSADRLGKVASMRLETPIVAIIDSDSPLPAAIAALDLYPWLSHVVSSALLDRPEATNHFATLLDRFAVGPEQGMMPAGTGRHALLASSKRREARLDRMRAFFARARVPTRTITSLVDVADELVLNALYDAPLEAGYFDRARERIDAVDLPPDRACEIAYIASTERASVRVRDPFGALKRRRMLDVLRRCSVNTGVGIDASSGGAGLGLWRIFSAASTIAITVVPNRLTEIVVGLSPKMARPANRFEAVHLFFDERGGSTVIPDDGVMFEHSITLTRPFDDTAPFVHERT